MKKVLLIIAHEGFQQTEYNVPKAILENAAVDVVTASDEPGIAIAKDGSKAQIDLTIDQIDVTDYDGIFLIGGPGALDCLDNSLIYSLMQEAKDKDKLFGAICISPRILAKSGLLTSKQATGWDGDNRLAELFNKYNVTYIQNPVVVDGKIITATGPSAAEEFGQAILTLLNV